MLGARFACPNTIIYIMDVILTKRVINETSKKSVV